MSASRFLLLPLALVAALAFGCATTESTTPLIVTPTAIVVAPADFLGDVVCSDSPGALRSYVATITDVTNPDGAFTLPSSPPVDCSVPSYFRYAIVNHLYSAEVDGYDVAPNELTPLGGEWSGARQMLVSGTSTFYTPRWTTSCSDSPTTVATAQYLTNIYVEGCAPLTDHSGSLTGIEFDFSAALGALTCNDVATLDVLPEDPSFLPTTGVPCSLGKLFFTSGITAGTQYVFDVAGHAAKNGPVVWGGRCFVKALEGVTTPVSCDPITNSGDVLFDPTALLAQSGVTCAPGIAFSAVVGGVSTTPAPCDQTIRMGPLPGGQVLTATLTVAKAGTPAALLTASCTATVAPGQTTTATCAF